MEQVSCELYEKESSELGMTIGTLLQRGGDVVER
jgi:hypothetical protein